MGRPCPPSLGLNYREPKTLKTFPRMKLDWFVLHVEHFIFFLEIDKGHLHVHGGPRKAKVDNLRI